MNTVHGTGYTAYAANPPPAENAANEPQTELYDMRDSRCEGYLGLTGREVHRFAVGFSCVLAPMHPELANN